MGGRERQKQRGKDEREKNGGESKIKLLYQLMLRQLRDTAIGYGQQEVATAIPTVLTPTTSTLIHPSPYAIKSERSPKWTKEVNSDFWLLLNRQVHFSCENQ